MKTNHLICVLCLLGLSACATTQSGSQSFDSPKDSQKEKEYTAWDYIEGAAMQIAYGMGTSGRTFSQ